MQCSVPQSSPRSNLWAQVGSSRHGAGQMDTDGQMDATHLTSGRHQSPSHTTGHFLASKPAFNLEFVIYHQNHGEREEAQQVIPWWGGEKNLFECGISAILWRQSQPGEMHVPRVWLSTLNLPEKKTPNPSCTHWSMARWWKSHSCNKLCSCSSPPALSLWFRFKEKKYWSNHLREKYIYLIP